MNSQDIPHNAYTDTPEQHPNLILGSLQLLFWLFFRSAAWRHHIARIDTNVHLDAGSVKRSSWNSALWRLRIQAYLVLPVLVNLPLFLVQWGLAFRVNFDVLFSAMLGVAIGIALSARSIKALSVMFILVISLMLTLTKGITPDIAGSVVQDIVGGVVVFIGICMVLVVSQLGVARECFLYVARSREWEIEEEHWTSIINKIIRFIISLGAYTIIGVIIGLIGTGLLEGANLSTDFVLILHIILLARIFTTIGVVLSLVFLVWGGCKLIISNGNMESLNEGINTIKNAIISFVVSLMVYTIVELITEGWSKSIRVNVFLSAVFSVGLTLNIWRPVIFYPLLIVWNNLLYQLDKRRPSHKNSFLRWHCAFWDEFQRLPLHGLDNHLFLVMDRNPTEGNAAIEYLNTSPQRWAAQEVQIKLDARRLEGCKDVEAIRQVHNSLTIGELQGPANYLLHRFSVISKEIDAALNRETAYNQRAAFRFVTGDLNSLLQELTRSSGKETVRFRPIAVRWENILTSYLSGLWEEVEQRQEIDNPYIIGIPLTEHQEIFVKPTDISGASISKRIEQLLLDQRRPPLLLYGQRRMGKTSLLNNLGRLLPNYIIPMFVDFQGPASRASDHAGFLYNLARGMVESAKRQADLTLPSLTREELAADAFTRFDEWLDKVEKALGRNTALLALDEIEVLDKVLTEGRFSETDVLGMLRNLIQHRPRFKVLLSGSHTIEEFHRWASYLINVQVVHISYLKDTEARKLIERPVKNFTLRYKSDAVERVIELTHCHPLLVQLLCAEIIALKNEHDPSIRRLATLTDVEEAVPEALNSGSFFFADIERNQVNIEGLKILRFLAAKGEGAIISQENLSRQFCEHLDNTLDLLLRRELIELVSNGYRFQVELIRRWFAKSG